MSKILLKRGLRNMPDVTINKPELLAPAGDYECLEMAVRYGADAVYLGGMEFGMRASAGNFDRDEITKAVQHAHAKDVKVYLTCNTLPRWNEMKGIEEYLTYISQSDIDALIIADIGVLSLAKKYAPNIPIHISTQFGVVNDVTATQLYEMGASRVVLARELSLEDIGEIKSRIPKGLEIEAFIHGAMCMSFSGRCLISNFMTDRDANRGACSQPCRWGYHVMEHKRPGEYHEVFETEEGTFLFNAKDLCMIEYIDKLCEAGISSLKIEGRAKSAYYVATVTNAYRHAVDNYIKDPSNFKSEQWLVDELHKVSHRQYSTGFFFGRPREGQYYENSGYVRNWDVIGIVTDCKDGMITVSQRNKFYKSDELEVMSPGVKPYTIKVDFILDDEGNEIDNAPRPMATVRIPCDTDVASGSLLRKKRAD